MARSFTNAIRVEGLDEFRKAMRELNPQMGRAFGAANKEVAEIVASEARAKADQLGGVHRHVKPSIKASAQQRFAAVTIGGPKFPMALGAEFGAKRYEQFPPWRGNQWPSTWVPEGVGYMIHPAIREKADQVRNEYGVAIMQLARKAFPGGQAA